MSAQSRTYDDFLKFLGSKPHKLFSRPEERIKVTEELLKGLTKTQENEKDN
jgi:hypothetical protein